MNLQELNQKYEQMSVEDRITSVYHDFDKVLFTSSFGTSAGQFFCTSSRN